MTMKRLDARAMDELARYFAALAVPMRLRILDALRDGEKNVGELTQATGCTQANVSKHLALLAQNGFVRKESRGTSAYYSIADPAIYALCDMVCGQIGRRYSEQAHMERLFRATRAGKARRATRAR
jgi:DNA-binding transcriptional ArsR family regulator